MQIAMIEPEDGIVRVHGKSQGFLGLPVRHVAMNGQNVMFTAWTPTPKELEALNAGANVIISMFGDLPPPMMVGTGKIPE